jgi:hypothetical protein
MTQRDGAIESVKLAEASGFDLAVTSCRPSTFVGRPQS